LGLKELQNLFRWPPDNGSISRNKNWPFNQDGMFNHRIDPVFFLHGFSLVKGFVNVFSFSYQCLGRYAQLLQQFSERFGIRRSLQVFHDLRMNAMLIQKFQSIATFTAPWVMIILHGAKIENFKKGNTDGTR